MESVAVGDGVGSKCGGMGSAHRLVLGVLVVVCVVVIWVGMFVVSVVLSVACVVLCVWVAVWVVGDGVGSIYDGMGSAHRSLALVFSCFGGGVR